MLETKIQTDTKDLLSKLVDAIDEDSNLKYPKAAINSLTQFINGINVVVTEYENYKKLYNENMKTMKLVKETMDKFKLVLDDPTTSDTSKVFMLKNILKLPV